MSAQKRELGKLVSFSISYLIWRKPYQTWVNMTYAPLRSEVNDLQIWCTCEMLSGCAGFSGETFHECRTRWAAKQLRKMPFEEGDQCGVLNLEIGAATGVHQHESAAHLKCTTLKHNGISLSGQLGDSFNNPHLHPKAFEIQRVWNFQMYCFLIHKTQR